MAARLEIYAVAEGTTISSYDPVRLEIEGADRSHLPDLEGFISASDEDEQELFEVLTAVADLTAVDVRILGAGVVATSEVIDLGAKLRLLASRRSGVSGAWLSSLAATVGKVERRATSLAWRMRYDMAGAGDSGPEEFPTTWS
jgi:hypothetical protein